MQLVYYWTYLTESFVFRRTSCVLYSTLCFSIVISWGIRSYLALPVRIGALDTRKWCVSSHKEGSIFIWVMFLEQEIAIYDCWNNKENIESSDEDSAPSTPIMTTAKQIEQLYRRLQCIRGELDKDHWENEMDERKRLEGRWMNLVKPSHETYRDDSDDSRLGQYTSNDEMQVSGLQSKHPRERKAFTIPPSTCCINEMPSEILVLVFELVLSTDEGYSDDAAEFGGRNGWRSPITLGHVCCSWRTLVLETPSLWRSFSLVLDTIPQLTEGLKASLHLWLQGSRSTEVAINLEVDPACAEILDHELMNQLEGMLRRCWRLRTNVSHEMFCGILQLPLSRLRTLEVWSSWLGKDIGGFSVQAPSLQNLVILGPTMVKFEENTLPWSQIQEYKGTCWADLQQHLDIFRLSPNLQSCTLYPFYETRGNLIPIRLTQLRRLHILSNFGTSMDNFLRCLDVPALEELKFEFDMWPQKSVLDLLERSGIELERLKLISRDNSQLYKF